MTHNFSKQKQPPIDKQQTSFTTSKIKAPFKSKRKKKQSGSDVGATCVVYTKLHCIDGQLLAYSGLTSQCDEPRIKIIVMGHLI